MNESQNEKRLSLFRPWELLGFGCHCAWMLVLVIDPTTLSKNEMDVFGGQVPLRVIMMAGVALCYAVIFLLYRKSKAASCSKGLIAAAGFSGFRVRRFLGWGSCFYPVACIGTARRIFLRVLDGCGQSVLDEKQARTSHAAAYGFERFRRCCVCRSDGSSFSFSYCACSRAASCRRFHFDS